MAMEVECELRRLFPWEAYWADVIRDRSKAARPTPLRDMMLQRSKSTMARER